MDLLINRLAQIKAGHVTTMYGVVVWKVGTGFIVGETVTAKGERLTTEDAAAAIMAHCRNRN